MGGAAAAGFGLGFITAAQVGPIWLLCLRSTLRSGFRVGVAIGAGAAIVDLAYAALGSLVAIFAYVTGSSLLRSLTGGIAAFALATAYTWWRLRARRRQAEQKP